MLSQGANVNIYLFFGGTSFGFKAGSNSPPFQATPTSYDYDAPITEVNVISCNEVQSIINSLKAGDLTDKFWEIRQTIGRYLPLDPIPDTLQNVTEKGKYGKVKLKFVSSIFDGLSSLSKSNNISRYPLNFESLDQSYGFMLYETEVADLQTDPVLLSIEGLRDRGTVFVDHKPAGVLSRSGQMFSLPVQVRPGQKLAILVENQGRICFGAELADRKGILGNVTLGGKVITGWRMTTLPLDDGHQLFRYARKMLDSSNKDKLFKKHLRYTPFSLRKKNWVVCLSFRGRITEEKMAFWHGEFKLGDSVEARDSFLALPGWQKGD